MAETTFGAWLREQRHEHKLSREEYADLIGCSPRTVRHLEQETRRPSKAMLARIFQVLEVPEDEQQRLQPLARRSELDSAIPASEIGTPVLHAYGRFIGREHEQALLVEQLQDPQIRLVTILGPPGVGKTRLAQEVGRQLETKAELRVIFVSLVELKEPQLLLQTIVAALKIPVNQNLQTALYTALQALPTLLILDNMEQLIDAALLLRELLDQVPGLRLLVTSRVPLQLYGERQSWLEPLSLPQQHPDGSWQDIERSAAVKLFVERVQQRNPNLQLHASEYPLIAAICSQLEGLPLALEIAASHIGRLSLIQLEAQIQAMAHLRFAGATEETVSQHQSLWAALEWSYSLLPKPTQQMWNALSLFGEGWTLACATAVLQASEADVLEQSARLADHGLIRLDLTAPTSRWQMLEAVRAYGMERLTQTPAQHEMLLQQTSQTIMAFLEADRTLFQEIKLNLPAVRAVLNWIDAHDPQGVLHLVGQLCSFWTIASMADEALWWIDRVHGSRPPTTVQEAQIINARAGFAVQQGAYEQARFYYRQILDLAKDVDDPNLERIGWTGIGLSLLRQGAWHDAEGAFLMAFEFVEPDTIFQWRAIGNLSVVHSHLGRYEAAVAGFQQMLEQTTNDRLAYAITLLNISVNGWCLGQNAHALQQLEQTIQTLREFPPSYYLFSALAFQCYALISSDSEDLSVVCGALRELLSFPETSFFQHQYIDFATASKLYLTAIEQYPEAIMLQGAIDHLRATYQIPYDTPFFAEQAAQFRAQLAQYVSPPIWQALITQGEQFSLSDLYRFLHTQLRQYL